MMKKRFSYIKFFMALSCFLVIAVAAPFFIKDKNGKALLTIDKIKVPEFSGLEVKKIKNLKLPDLFKSLKTKTKPQVKLVKGTNRSTETTYKWKDQNNQWHFADYCPEGIACENVSSSPLIAVEKKDAPINIDHTIQSAESILADRKKDIEKVKDKLFELKPPLTIPYKDAVHIKQNAEKVKEQLEQHYQNQEKLLNQN